jgi:hypothetical protein
LAVHPLKKRQLADSTLRQLAQLGLPEPVMPMLARIEKE